MPITSFSVGACHTINLGNYESLKVEASIVVTVDDSEPYPDVTARAQTQLRELLEKTYKAQRRRGDE